jgi:hypothetical protein
LSYVQLKKQELEVIKDKERELNTLEALQESLNYTDQNIENNILTIKNDLKTYYFHIILEFRHRPEKICQLNEHLNYLLFLYLNKVSCKIC